MGYNEHHYVSSCGICSRTEYEITIFEWTDYGLSICHKCQSHLTHPDSCVGAWRYLGLAVERKHMTHINTWRRRQHEDPG